MAVITIWHNPGCSKSRATLALIESRGPVVVRRYLEDVPTKDELAHVQALLGVAAIDMMRTGEHVFGAMGLSRNMSDDDLRGAMANNPIVIERPIVISGGKAAIADRRKPFSTFCEGPIGRSRPVSRPCGRLCRLGVAAC